MTWVAVSLLLFEAQYILGTGLSMTNPTKTISHQRHSNGFVDDTTGYRIANSRNGSTRHRPSKRFSKDYKKRPKSGNVFFGRRGGALGTQQVPILCRKLDLYYRRPGQVGSKSRDEHSGMQITEGDTGRLQTVEQLDLDDAFKTLGIQMTILGSQTAQIAAMKTKSDKTSTTPSRLSGSR